MSNGNASQGTTPITDSPPDVTEAQAREQAIQEAKEKAEKIAKELADIVLQQQGPPGTPRLSRP